MKTCTRCQKEKPFSEFHNKKTRNGNPGKCSRCRSCECEVKKSRYDPVKKREYDLVTQFGITSNDYEEMYQKQQGSCAICGTTEFNYSRGKRPHIDHCHQTGRVRGLLCGHCNIGIGQFFDNVDLLQNAITYLQKHAR
jgi:hypothetical protein